MGEVLGSKSFQVRGFRFMNCVNSEPLNVNPVTQMQVQPILFNTQSTLLLAT